MAKRKKRKRFSVGRLVDAVKRGIKKVKETVTGKSSGGSKKSRKGKQASDAVGQTKGARKQAGAANRSGGSRSATAQQDRSLNQRARRRRSGNATGRQRK